MGLVPIQSVADPRLGSYRQLKDRRLAEEQGRFIAEGRHVVLRLLGSSFPVDSVLLAERCVESVAGLVPPAVPVFVVADPLIHEVVGFRFHSGVIACGRRRPWPALADLVGTASAPGTTPRTVVACPEVHNHENLGSLIRICAAFGVDGLLLGERCCDPYWRRSIRVSMGAAFHLPIRRAQDVAVELSELRREMGFELLATVAQGPAQPLHLAQRPPRLALLFGSESQGLGQPYLDACDRRVTIPMRRGTDSLNVAVAAGIFLHHFSDRAPACVPPVAGLEDGPPVR